jgi:hypothetical protein
MLSDGDVVREIISTYFGPGSSPTSVRNLGRGILDNGGLVLAQSEFRISKNIWISVSTYAGSIPRCKFIESSLADSMPFAAVGASERARPPSRDVSLVQKIVFLVSSRERKGLGGLRVINLTFNTYVKASLGINAKLWIP